MTKKPKLDYCLTLKFKHNKVANFFNAMADDFAHCSYTMQVDSTGANTVIKITCLNSFAEVLADIFRDEVAGVAFPSNSPLAGIL